MKILASCLQAALNDSDNNSVSLRGLLADMSLNHWPESLHTLVTQTQKERGVGATPKKPPDDHTPLCCHVLRCPSLKSFSCAMPVSFYPFLESTAVPRDLRVFNMT